MRARDNPFTIERIHSLGYRFPPGAGWELLLARLDAQNRRGALVGGEGRGKSTLLTELGERLAARGHDVRRLTLRRGQRRLPPRQGSAFLTDLGPRVALLLDGAEQLSWWRWRRLRSRTLAAGAFVVTSHRQGLLPTLLACDTSARTLREILDALAPRRDPGFPSAEELHARYCGDVRQALFEAYDRGSAAGSAPDRRRNPAPSQALANSRAAAAGTSHGARA